jgi:hypothetical protein
VVDVFAAVAIDGLGMLIAGVGGPGGIEGSGEVDGVDHRIIFLHGELEGLGPVVESEGIAVAFAPRGLVVPGRRTADPADIVAELGVELIEEAAAEALLEEEGSAAGVGVAVLDEQATRHDGEFVVGDGFPTYTEHGGVLGLDLGVVELGLGGSDGGENEDGKSGAGAWIDGHLISLF